MLYSNKLVSNLIWTSICNARYFCFRYNFSYLGNFSTASFFAHNGDVWIAILSMVTKKRKLPKTSLYLLSHLFHPLFLFFSSTFLKIYPEIFKYLAILKCILMSECAPMFECKVSLNLFYTAPIVEYLPDNIALLDKQLQWQKNNQH